MSDVTLIDGKAFSIGLRERIKEEVIHLKKNHNITPGLAVVLIGEDPASQVYVHNKGKQTLEVGMNSFERRFESDITQNTLLELIDELNADENVNGILVQLPLPKHINEAAVLEAINPNKDVDGFHLVNVGRLGTGDANAIVPCTPLGCLMMLKDRLGDLSGLKALVLGRSNIVGKPMAQLLLKESCTVTIAHSKTKSLPEFCSSADIIIAAVGKPNMVKGNWIKDGAIVIDVGINRIQKEIKGEIKNKIVGDVDFFECEPKASAITPVPGGVGPMTIACLLRNTTIAFKNSLSKKTDNLN